ncbi:MAG TPA: transposase [Planctomycetota bacterium]|nr:transposase [Planctomycetota bacterium]
MVDRELEAFLEEFDSCATAPTRRLMGAYVRGQLAPLERKTVRSLARAAGVAARTLQEFLSLHRWDEERVRSLVARIGARRHGAAAEAAFLHLSGRPKKGDRTPGVDRQHCPSTGRVENCCVLVHLGRVDGTFRCLLESDVSLSERWAQEERRLRAGIPEGVAGRSKGRVALDLLERAERRGLRFGCVLATRDLGREPEWVEEVARRGRAFLVEVPGDFAGRAAGREGPVRDLAGAGDALLAFALRGNEEDRPLRLLALREGGYFVTNLPGSLEDLAERARDVARLEKAFAADRRAVGLEEFEVRGYRSLRRHLALSAVSLLYLALRRQESPMARPFEGPVAL